MALDLDAAAGLLGVSSETVRRWARQGLLGARRPSGELRFEPEELRRWALRHGLKLREGTSGRTEVTATAAPLMAALTRGGVLRDLEGRTAAEVLGQVIARAPLAESADREHLLAELLQRESLSSTGLGQGVALPHPRHPSPRFAKEPLVVLGFPKEPADWQALDGKPVRACFLLLCPTPSQHLQVLSRLAFLLRDPAFGDLLAEGPDDATLFAEIERREPAAG